MNRIDRLVGVLTTLQSRRYTPAEFLTEKYEISERTVYRDIHALCEIGVPIDFVSGKGYYILQGYFLPPVSFTIDEANALVLMGSLSGKFSGNSVLKSYETAITKVKSILRTEEKEKVDFFDSQIKVYTPSGHQTPDYLLDIQRAIINKVILHLEYKNNKEEHSLREIEPIGLTFYSNQWHIIACCWKRLGYRDFKTTGILGLKKYESGVSQT